jgi:hypothetical protein
MVDESWLPIKGYEGCYEVSNLGRVRSLRFVNRMVNKLRDEPLILKPIKHNLGYLRVSLGKSGRHKQFLVQGLVLEAFVGPRPLKHEAAHLDGSRDNNVLSNLKWVTSKENHSHRRIHGTQPLGEQCLSSVLTKEQVLEIRSLKDKQSTYVLGRKYGVTPEAIQAIHRRRNWKHI